MNLCPTLWPARAIQLLARNGRNAIITLAFAANVATAQQAAPVCGDAGIQERVAQLIQTALGPYRPEDDSPPGATNQAWRNLLQIEANFREASALMPARFDLRFGLASSLVLQALHTNSQFAPKMREALQVYHHLYGSDTNGFEAPLLYAAYHRAVGDSASSSQALAQLLATHPERTKPYLDRFQRVDDILRLSPSTEPLRTMPLGTNHAIVVLGAALDTNGTMKPKLLGRLQQALVLARIYPDAPIIVTGGNQRRGVTEAYLMSQWLMNEGVPSERVHLEDRARDTLANAVFSSAILRKLGASHVTLVTSATHIRRALVNLEETGLQAGLKLQFAHLASAEDPVTDPGRERLAIYRDLLRASGLWAFPGVQR